MHKFILSLAIISGIFIAGDAYAAKKKSGDDDGGGAMEYVKMNPLILPVIDNDGISQVLNIVVVIEVAGVSDADKVKAKKIRLNDAYIQDMYGSLNEHEALKNGVVQVNMIKERLNRITDDVVGDDVETEVLLQVVEQRPI